MRESRRDESLIGAHLRLPTVKVQNLRCDKTNLARRVPSASEENTTIEEIVKQKHKKFF